MEPSAEYFFYTVRYVPEPRKAEFSRAAFARPETSEEYRVWNLNTEYDRDLRRRNHRSFSQAGSFLYFDTK